MKVVRGFDDIVPEWEAASATIGNFDGVHRGHQAVIGRAVGTARQRSVTAVVCTFDPHTAEILDPAGAPDLLQTLDQRLDAIASMGADVAVVIPFDEEVAAVEPEEVVRRFIAGTLRARWLHVSREFTFGRDGAGDVETLRTLGPRFDIELDVVSPVYEEGEPISSTRIRRLLGRGEVEEARRLLGRPFALVGEVVGGAGRGRDLDAPTANLEVENGCRPATGVYVTVVRLDGDSRPSVTNVGRRPTFDGAREPVVETHLLDFEADLYGRKIEVAFLRRLRDEIRFDGADELARQIAEDVRRARSFFAETEGPV